MAKNKFLLVSLKEKESKDLAQIMANDTSRKILDFLAEKEGTASELSKKLNVPLPTIHYNLKALVKGKLVEADEFHYSSKGKEVLHYKLANKYIIIAPKSTYGIKEKLKSILPVGIIVLATSFFINLKSQPQVAKVAAARTADFALAESAAFDAAPAIASSTSISPGVWFLIGCCVSIALLLLIEYFLQKKK